MNQFYAIPANGDARIGLVQVLYKVVADCGGSIRVCRMTALGSDIAMLMLVAGNWHSMARIETDLSKLGESSGITIQVRRTVQRPVREDMVPYSVDVVCIDQAGIVSGLSGFFAARGIDIGELSTRNYAAAHTGAQMFSVYMVVNVPSRIHVGALREEFMDFCDQMNLDAILEPVKN
jgi:glycine cleavage system transcriptional repressor